MIRNLLIIELFFVSTVSRERKKLNRYSHKLNGIVCKTVCFLYTYLCNPCVSLVRFSLFSPISIKMLFLSQHRCQVGGSLLGFFNKGNDLLMSLHCKMVFNYECMPLNCMFKVVGMHILSYSVFRSS